MKTARGATKGWGSSSGISAARMAGRAPGLPVENLGGNLGYLKPSARMISQEAAEEAEMFRLCSLCWLL
jgi:hypothetical protein